MTRPRRASVYTTPGNGHPWGPHMYYPRPGLIARLRAWWDADYTAGFTAGYRAGYDAGYQHADLED